MRQELKQKKYGAPCEANMKSRYNIPADCMHPAIASLKPEGPSDALYRIDSPNAEDESIGDSAFDDSTSSAISSSFQGTETDSVQDELIIATSTENSLPEKRLPGIEKAIDRLYRLSLLIRQPSRSSQNEKAELFIMKDEDDNELNDTFAAFALQIVNHCFPHAPEFLRHKLSHGIVIRRQRFLYRQHHQRKLSVVYSSKENMRKDLGYEANFEETDTTVRASRVADEPSLSPTLILELQRSKNSDLSQTSASALRKQNLPLDTALEDIRSNQSTAFTATPSLSAPVELPRPPKPAAGSKEFECPYCCLILPIKESKASHWRYVIARFVGLL
jgi:hypothetical protein